MLLRVALLAMLALGLSGIAGIAWFAMPHAAPDAVPAAEARISILVASGPLRAGSLIKPADLRSVEMARGEAPSGASVDSPQERGTLTGSMIRRSLGEGQPILPGDIVRPGDHGFLAAVLRPDMRAVTVAVDAVSGTAGLIWPGDLVDVILTQSLDDPALAVGHRVAAQTVLSGARVIAIDQQLVQGQAPEGAAPPANRTATLEVTQAQAERILVAGKLGHLSLSVLSSERSTAELAGGAAPPAAPAGVTWGSDVSPALGNTETHAPPVMVHVFQGDAEPKDFHF